MSAANVEEDLEDPQADGLQNLLDKIADQLADLSNAEVLPIGFKSVAEVFESEEVDFNSNSWLLRLIQVQLWLRPDASLTVRSVEADPIAATQKFFGSIGAGNNAQYVVLHGAVAALTWDGAEYLSERLDTSLTHQHRFLESLEEHSRQQATVDWVEAWDDEDDGVDGEPEPIKAKSDTWRINDFSGKASRNLLNLNPSYQRGDVWPTSDAQKLIESILRGIPLPSIILLKPNGTLQSRYEVVDGKQRLTSILRFMGKHPAAIELVRQKDLQFPNANLALHFRENYKKFRKVWKTVVGTTLTDKLEAEYYFPFRLGKTVGRLSTLAGKYYCDIREEIISVGEGEVAVLDVFEGASDYKIPLIEYLDASPKQIHEVFNLYNKQGKHLNAEEIRNASYHDVDLVRLVLIASGDNPNVFALAPYFPSEKYALLSRTSRCLSDYRFGQARYRRTKLLSWMYALLFQPSIADDGSLTIKSTAKQINSLFASIRAGNGQPLTHSLSVHDVLVKLIEDTEKCFDVHSSADCWAAVFKDDDAGLKWQELQLVASLVGTFLLGVISDDLDGLFESKRDEFFEFSSHHRRPKKTQNDAQWGFVGEVSIGMLEVAGIDLGLLSTKLMERYGVDCIPTLRAARAYYEPREER